MFMPSISGWRSGLKLRELHGSWSGSLLMASMLGFGTARMISHEALYRALSRVFIAGAIRRRRAGARKQARWWTMELFERVDFPLSAS